VAAFGVASTPYGDKDKTGVSRQAAYNLILGAVKGVQLRGSQWAVSKLTSNDYCGFVAAAGFGTAGFGVAGLAGAAVPAAPTSVAVLMESSLGQPLSK
jgi:hypothetical protein